MQFEIAEKISCDKWKVKVLHTSAASWNRHRKIQNGSELASTSWSCNLMRFSRLSSWKSKINNFFTRKIASFKIFCTMNFQLIKILLVECLSTRNEQKLCVFFGFSFFHCCKLNLKLKSFNACDHILCLNACLHFDWKWNWSETRFMNIYDLTQG